MHDMMNGISSDCGTAWCIDTELFIIHGLAKSVHTWGVVTSGIA